MQTRSPGPRPPRPGGRAVPAPAGGRWRPGRPAARGRLEQGAAHAHWSTTAARRTSATAATRALRANRRETPPLPLTPGTRNRTPANLGSRDSRTEGTEAALRPPRGRGVGRDWEVRVSRGKPVPKGRATRPDWLHRASIQRPRANRPGKSRKKEATCSGVTCSTEVRIPR